MPTNYSDQFFTFDPANPPAVGAAVNFSVFGIVDQDDDDDIGAAGGDTVNGSDVTASWPGDTVTINVPGIGNVTYTGITFYTADGGRYFTPTDGQVLQNGTFVSSTFVNGQAPLDVGDLGPPCFVAGTMIDTPTGPRQVEELKVGDLVTTLDDGPQEIRWMGKREVVGLGTLSPVEFLAGAIGNMESLRLSPQHRVLISSWAAQMHFGETEVLVAAKHLVNGASIRFSPNRSVTYVHFMFDKHQIVFADGAKVESFFPGDYMMGADTELRDEILSIFPELNLGEDPETSETVRPVINRRESGILFTQQ
jgi:hypothetical protein